MRRAAIDIGTNSVKLLVAEVDGQAVRPLWEESEQTRLGQGFYRAQQLQPEAIARSAAAVARLKQRAAEWGPVSVRLIATSAVRDAVNQSDLLQAVHTASGLTVEVVSGEQEADWAFTGVCTDPLLRRQRLMILDVGGGSTEVILGHASHSDFKASYALGTVRLLEILQPHDPPAEDWPRCHSYLTEFLTKQIQPMLQPRIAALSPKAVELVGTGGTTSIMAAMELRLSRFERERIEQTTLTRERVWELQQLLWSVPLEARRRLPGLPANRADVILFGVAIYAVMMDTFGFPQLRVSTRGIRFAAVL
jgi:exopolyphosphatase/guanosine-5'-triphosphate,3'-diphosphate pyrophosphatase